MAVSSISGSVDNATKVAGLSLEDLMKVLLTELTYQDPLKPVENKDFLAQMAQFSALDTSRQLNDSLQSLLTMQSLNQSVGLLGKTVDALKDGELISGEVTALSLSSGSPLVTIKDKDGEVFTGITMSDVQTIR